MFLIIAHHGMVDVGGLSCLLSSHIMVGFTWVDCPISFFVFVVFVYLFTSLFYFLFGSLSVFRLEITVPVGWALNTNN